MPSSAKKQKAAQKKKEMQATHHYHHQQPHSNVGVHSHGDDDIKHHDDDKHSDPEELDSPTSQKDLEVPKSSDCQASLPATPRVVKRTSWMDCCGLFAVFTGSNR